jgi:hypothetical protein
MEQDQILILLQLQFETLLLLSGQIQRLQEEVHALRRSQEDMSVAQNAILHVIAEDYSEFPPISPN